MNAEEKEEVNKNDPREETWDNRRLMRREGWGLKNRKVFPEIHKGNEIKEGVDLIVQKVIMNKK